MVDHWLCLFTEGIVNHLDIRITSRLKPEMFLDSCRNSLIAFRVTCLVAFNQHVVNFVKFMAASTRTYQKMAVPKVTTLVLLRYNVYASQKSV